MRTAFIVFEKKKKEIEEENSCFEENQIKENKIHKDLE